MAEPVKKQPDAAPAAEPAPISREAVQAMAKRVIARYPRVMAKLAE